MTAQTQTERGGDISDDSTDTNRGVEILVMTAQTQTERGADISDDSTDTHRDPSCKCWLNTGLTWHQVGHLGTPMEDVIRETVLFRHIRCPAVSLEKEKIDRCH